jgi:phospholipase/carboxylesterase
VIGHRERPAAGDPEGALVLMHGRGADESDLFPLFDLLDPDRRLLGLSPRGPLSLPPGGAHWYAVARIGYPDPNTFWTVYPQVAEWLDSTLAHNGLDLSQTVLGGFSQGGVMSYALGLNAERPAPKGIVAMSSFIPTVEGLDLDLERDIPFSVAHGTHDPIIGVEWGHDARDRLTSNGADVLYREYPMGHTVHPDFVEETRQRIEG